MTTINRESLKEIIIAILLTLPFYLYGQQVEFDLDPQGYIKNWYNSGISETPYTKDFGKEADIPNEREILNKTPLEFDIPKINPFNENLSNGIKLKLYTMGSNIFVQNPKFFFTPTLIRSYSLTQIKSDKECDLTVSMATIVCKIRLWCNGVEVNTNSETKKVGRYEISSFKIPIKKGINTLFIRQIDLAVRDNVFDFSLRIEDNKENIKIVLPGDQNKIRDFFEADKWLQSISLSKDGTFSSNIPPVTTTKILPGNNIVINWGKDMTQMPIDISQKKELPIKIRVRSYLRNGTTMYRDFRIYSPQSNTEEKKEGLKSIQKEYVNKILNEDIKTTYYTPGVITLKLLNGHKLSSNDKKELYEICSGINKRKDCSDFYLAFILRLYILCNENLPDDIKETIKKTVINFRYWDDEKGSDAMYFYTENHRLLFNSCQMIAGDLFPNDIFTSSGRTGKQQKEIGYERVNNWMKEYETYGSEEFLGPGYIAVTLLAMLNVYDFTTNENQRKHMELLIDNTLRLAAISTFDGVCLGATGRAYDKELLNAEISSKQAMLSLFTSKLKTNYDYWATSFLTSKYHCNVNIDSLVNTHNIKDISNQGGAKLYIYKQKDYFISSLIIPSPEVKNKNNKDVYIPGEGLYQQHIWEAAIGGSARVFVTHPGSSTDITSNRPGYWGGNSICPTLNFKNNILTEIFNIPKHHPFQFTHAYFPFEEFDKYEIGKDGHWAFASKDNGYLALWCSTPLQVVNNAFGKCELRAYGGNVAWICILSSKKEESNFRTFVNRVKGLNPIYEINSKTVKLNGKHLLQWKESY